MSEVKEQIKIEKPTQREVALCFLLSRQYTLLRELFVDLEPLMKKETSAKYAKLLSEVHGGINDFVSTFPND